MREREEELKKKGGGTCETDRVKPTAVSSLR